MIPTGTFAENGSWRCWLSCGDPDAPLLELVWQISGMVPRVLLQVGQMGECASLASATSKPAPGRVEGPSGHTYEAGLSTHLIEVTEAVLGEWENGAGGKVQLLQAGSDIDTSEVIVRRALDLLRHVASSAPESLDSEGLLALLQERSAIWTTW